jgi:hypothetical protein
MLEKSACFFSLTCHIGCMRAALLGKLCFGIINMDILLLWVVMPISSFGNRLAQRRQESNFLFGGCNYVDLLYYGY